MHKALFFAVTLLAAASAPAAPAVPVQSVLLLAIITPI